jgi:hypothetical protein
VRDISNISAGKQIMHFILNGTFPDRASFNNERDLFISKFDLSLRKE